MPSHPALLLIELDSVAVGTEMADAMIKRAPVDTFRAGTVQPGRFLILVGGSVAAVEEALTAANMRRGGDLGRAVPAGRASGCLRVGRRASAARTGRCLGSDRNSFGGSRDSRRRPSAQDGQRAADRDAFGRRLGRQGNRAGFRNLEEVQAAIEAGVAAAGRDGDATRSVVIPSQHEDLRKHLEESTQFYNKTALWPSPDRPEPDQGSRRSRG